MNLYKQVVNAAAKLVYGKLVKRGGNDAPDRLKLAAFLKKRGLSVRQLRGMREMATNKEQADELRDAIRSRRMR